MYHEITAKLFNSPSVNLVDLHIYVYETEKALGENTRLSSEKRPGA